MKIKVYKNILISARTLPALCLCTLFLLPSCAPKKLPSTEEKERPYLVSRRKLPPQPTYSRLTWSQLPAPITPKRRITNDVPVMLPVIHFELSNTTLEETAMILAATSRYQSQCADEIKAQRISINILGTVDEIAAEIGRQAQIEVRVDHSRKLIDFGVHYQEGNSEPSYSEDLGSL